MQNLRKGEAFYLDRVPGYRDAVMRNKAVEFQQREDVWLGFSTIVAGVRLRVMTVRDYVALMRLRSPFLVRREPTFDDLGTFLWLLSDRIERWHNKESWRKYFPRFERLEVFTFGRRLRKRLKISELEDQAIKFNSENEGKIFTMPDDCALAVAITECFQYVDRIFLDRPVSIGESQAGSGMLYLTSWFDAIQSEYGKNDEEVWKMPLPHLFGRLQAMQARKNPENSSLSDRQTKVNQQLQRATQSGMSVDEVLNGRLKFNDN